jgi:hypothetical protein
VPLDIDNDGKPENLFMQRDCGQLARNLLVLKPGDTAIDAAKTRMLMQHPSREDAHWPDIRAPRGGDVVVEGNAVASADAYTFANHQIFRFHDRTYFDLWWKQEPDRSNDERRLRVFLAQGDRLSEVCLYRMRLRTANAAE